MADITSFETSGSPVTAPKSSRASLKLVFPACAWPGKSGAEPAERRGDGVTESGRARDVSQRVVAAAAAVAEET